MNSSSVLKSAPAAALAIAALWAAAASSGHASIGVGAALRLSRHPVAVSNAWRRYDEAPVHALIRPVRVLRVTGAVSNPMALTASGSGRTTLTYSPGGTAPSLVLDYGQDVGGRAMFEVTATSGTTITATYSETLANLGNDGALNTTLRRCADAGDCTAVSVPCCNIARYSGISADLAR